MKNDWTVFRKVIKKNFLSLQVIWNGGGIRLANNGINIYICIYPGADTLPCSTETLPHTELVSSRFSLAAGPAVDASPLVYPLV